MTTSNYKLIDTQRSMSAALKKLGGFKSLAVDMEMENHYHHYGLHIALIQVTTPDNTNYVFDPLSEIDVQPLGELFMNSDVQIVIHDSEFDKRACHEIYGWKLNHMFDTKVAAQLCVIRQY